MKKSVLLYAAMFVAAFSLSAQTTTVWNAGNDWPISSGLALGNANPATLPGGTITYNGLTINTGLVSNTSTSPCGVVIAASPAKTFTDANSVSYTFANIFKLNGSGYTGALATDATPTVNMPTTRYATFKVNGNSTIYMIGQTGSNSTARKMFVTDGTNFIGAINFPVISSGTILNDGKIEYVGPATTLYIFGNASVFLYYISATNVDLSASVNKPLADKAIKFDGKQLLNTQGVNIEVYNLLGKKVATSNTNIATAKLGKGVFFVRTSDGKEVLKFNN